MWPYGRHFFRPIITFLTYSSFTLDLVQFVMAGGTAHCSTHSRVMSRDKLAVTGLMQWCMDLTSLMNMERECSGVGGKIRWVGAERWAGVKNYSGAGTECGAGGRGVGMEHRAGVTEIGLSSEWEFCLSNSALMLWLPVSVTFMQWLSWIWKKDCCCMIIGTQCTSHSFLLTLTGLTCMWRTTANSKTELINN